MKPKKLVMSRLLTALPALLLTAIASWAPQPALHAQGNGKLTILHSFNPGGPDDDGLKPHAALILGGDGAYYGLTQEGGAYGYGTIYRLSADGQTVTTLHSFNNAGDGATPEVALLKGKDGAFYGTTFSGGTYNIGTIFRLSADGQTFTTVHQFTGVKGEGGLPACALIQASDGGFYGTTTIGTNDGSGNAAADGTIFRLSNDTLTLTTLHEFTGADGSVPSILIQATGGVFFGVTNVGGKLTPPVKKDLFGTLYQLSADGKTFTTLHDFTGKFGEGTNPDGLLEGPDGTIYGTTEYGGTSNNGTIFQLSADGQTLTTLHSFTGTGNEGATPLAGLCFGRDGGLYGTTYGGGADGAGTVYELSSNGQSQMVLTTLHSFTGNNGDGANPGAALLLGSNSKLYGTTDGGGRDFDGTVFVLGSVPKVKPTVTLKATTPTVTVGSGGKAVLTLTLSAAQTNDVLVKFTIKGSAVDGTDYNLVKDSVTIKAGKKSKPIDIIPKGDLSDAAEKTVVLTLEPGTGYTVGTADKAMVKILAKP